MTAEITPVPGTKQDSVFEKYGKLMVQQELLTQQINECKIEINKQINASAPTGPTLASGAKPTGPTGPAK